MKTFILLFCTTVFSLTTENTYSQEKVIINKDQLISVDHVFRIIQKQTKYAFIYPKGLFKDAPKVELKKGEITLGELLKLSITQNKLNFELTQDNVIVINEKRINAALNQQQITGVITTSDSVPLAGATIIEKGTKNGTQSDFDGAFNLTVTNANAILVFSYIGYVTQEIAVNGRTTFDITLQEDTAVLDEVIVVGYGTKTKATLTGAVTTVGAKNFEAKPAANIVNSIQGRIPGLLVVRNSGQLGNEGNAFEIRGETSRSSTGVLTIIDGIPQRSLGTGAIESINPEDIETFTVLKDAQAAIYGSRAAGGVILITTKKGKSSKPTVRYTSNLSINTVGNFLARTNVKQHFEMFNEAWVNDGVPNHFFAGIQDQVFAADLSNPQIIPGPFSDTPTLWTGHNEWMETMWGTSVWQNHNLSISGRGDRSNYYTSFQYLDQQSQLQYGANSNEKLAFRTRYDYEVIEDKLTIGANISMDQQTTMTPNRYGRMLGAMQSAWTSQPVTTPEGNFYHFGGFASPNGHAALGGENKLIRRNINLQFNAEFKPIKDLTINAQFATFKELDERKDLGRIYRFYLWDDTPSAWGSQRNSISNEYGSTTHNTANLYATYKKNIKEHNFSLMVGTAHEEDFDNGFRAWRNDLSDENFPILDFGDPEEQFNSESGSHYAIKSLFSRLSYDYQGKYIFNATIRKDQSSRFASGFRDGYFPGASVGWIVTKEGFMENLNNSINYLKLRLSWGELGNQNNVGRFDHISRISKGGAPLFGPNGSPIQGNSASIGTLADPNRTWETVEVRNIGVDFSFLNSRLSGSFDYFKKHTRDMLLSLVFPETLGINTVTVNGGELKSKGYELSLGWKDNIKDFNYSIKATLNNDTNEVTRLDDSRNISEGQNNFLEGHSTDTYYGFVFDGFFQTQAEADDYKANTASNFAGFPFQPGDASYKDLDGDGELEFTPYKEGDPESGDMVNLGDGRRHNIFSLDLSFDYKGFDFSAFFQGVGKWNIYTNDSPVGSDWWNQPFAYTYNTTWSPDRPNALRPRLSANGGIDFNNYQMHSNAPHRKINNAYVRLKNIQLGYTIPSAVMDNLGISKFRVYFSGVDLWELTNKNLPDGSDPERPFGSAFTPFVRSYSFGIDLTF
ncbi:SusC/RagA family TonB-linked outer membrane protein [Flavivirga spongiicola]|uniref:TonB-dependent receptor n=1 Tax=Flavivirga spongiicola TaxID=421621 RepID=A0ABU7XU95_9FLAO|nr:TonB-dependent receptor [Flavivirga sp. MEBiC05379]MDO5979082.1 TonB-dependent receptor [Flavivirga sp. MEBiC05379]